MRRQTLAIAISAPVLPAEIAQSASPRLTASTARHIDETRRPWRNAWLGLSVIFTATLQWITLAFVASLECFARIGAISFSSPNSRNLVSGLRSSAIAAAGTTTLGP